MAGLICLVVFMSTFYLLTRRLVPPPTVETEEELLQQEYNKKEAKIEARRQRSELRQHYRSQAESLRTATNVGRFTKKIIKKLK